jgi:S-adenosylmethionine hydrolase
VALTASRYFLPNISNTFHGRDLFAPVAAHLSLGVAPNKLGAAVARPATLAWPRIKRKGKQLVGTIMSVDRFGNLITNLEPSHWNGVRRPMLVAGTFRTDRLRESYAEVDKGELLIVFGGYGLLEIAVREGSARERLGLTQGDRVLLAAG